MRFNIEGEPMPVVVCELESGEMMITEKGAMSWMSPEYADEYCWRRNWKNIWKNG